MAYYDGEEQMLIDTAPPAAAPSPSEDAYYESLHATYPSRPFRLFDLPRELRDNIYDYALADRAAFKLSRRKASPGEANAEPDATSRPEDAVDDGAEESEHSSPGIQATLKHRASTNMLLACKALKTEYEERAQTAMLVVLQDHDRFAFQPFTMPPQAAKVQNFELHLILFCHSCNAMSHLNEKSCHAALELNQHQLWINKLLPELSNLRSLAVHAYISHDRYRSDSKQDIPCEPVVLNKFQQMRCLAKAKNLSLYKYDYNGYPELDGPKAIVWQWSVRDGVTSKPKPPPPPAPASDDEGESKAVDEDGDVTMSA